MRLYRRSLLAGMAAMMASPGSGWAQGRDVVDAVGRRIRVPVQPRRVMAAGPPATILLYGMAPEVMVGWVPAPVEAAKPYLLPAVRDLPATVRLTGRGDPDLAAIKTLQPDLIVDFGSTAQRYVGLADRVQSATGIPYALVDGSLDHAAAALRLTGILLGRDARGEVLAAYAAKTLASIDDALKAIPEASRPRVYLARGADGLLTAARGSGLSEILERAGAINVVDGTPGRDGAVTVSYEQISAWRPDIVIAADRASFYAIRAGAEWQAIAPKRVVAAPMLPWSWLGEPPSINRLMGLRWLGAALYSGRMGFDLMAEARDFHRLFYGVVPTDADLTTLLQNAL